MALLCRNSSDPCSRTDLQHGRSPAPPAGKRPGTRTEPFTRRVGYLDLQKYTKDHELCQWCAKSLEYTEFCFGTPANCGILDYLDGRQFVGQDVPAGTPITANPTFAKIGLLQLHAQ